jgi:hypothetical protein
MTIGNEINTSVTEGVNTSCQTEIGTYVTASVFSEDIVTKTNTSVKRRREIRASGNLKLIKVRMIPW